MGRMGPQGVACWMPARRKRASQLKDLQGRRMDDRTGRLWLWVRRDVLMQSLSLAQAEANPIGVGNWTDDDAFAARLGG